MSKSDAFENALLLLLFNATAFTGIAQNHATPSDLYMALHTADPGEAGTLATSEISYTGYARKQLARNGTNFTVVGDTVSLAANQDFPASTGGTGGTVTHWSIGTSAGVMLYRGAVSPTIAVSSGVTPRLNAGTLVTEA
jgi:hypothetical protein